MFDNVTTTIRDFISSILGTYTPTTIVVDGVVTPLQGIGSLDWSYIFTGLIFSIVVFCLFRALGYLLTRIF